MNYSHDNWSAILAHIGKPEELDTSARNAGALTRRREIRDAATLLRLGLAYGPGGMSLREVTAWAQLHDVATLTDRYEDHIPYVVAIQRCRPRAH